ncbi:MAG: PAS domain-containing protein [Candidatus Eisenbacteria bacterium]|nr:PAS domain-containing protein [Candidatus Eisenbacteria bacterium]
MTASTPRDDMRRDTAALASILPALMEALPDAVVVLDRGRRIVTANRRYVEAFGMKRADAPCPACPDALGAADLVTPADDGARCATCAALDFGRPQRGLRQVPAAAGAVRRYEATFTPVTAADGRVTHVVEVWRDITEKSLLEVQLSHSERLASVGILAAGVAHEINNPLASMLAGVETLERLLKRARFDAEGIAEAAEIATMLEVEIERCRETTRKLRLLGRSYDTTPGWVDLNVAVRDTLALLRYELRTRDLEVAERLEPDLPQVWAREAGIRGICMNLMLNAVQAMNAGGCLTVMTKRIDHAVALSVGDTGTGILPEHLERIWDPFFTTKPVGQGTGLGLSITHRIVTRHGGRITVDSAPGRGTRFDVELPIHGPGGEG